MTAFFKSLLTKFEGGNEDVAGNILLINKLFANHKTTLPPEHLVARHSSANKLDNEFVPLKSGVLNLIIY